MTSKVLRAVASMACCATLVGCGPATEAPPTPTPQVQGFHSTACNGISDADIASVIGTLSFTKVVANDLGCFWQENTVIGTYGVGMGISTWWYRGSDMDAERRLEQRAGRALTEVELDGNKGFKAGDDNACSVYVTKGDDVIAMSIQTLNPGLLPDLCTITEKLAQLSQDRVN